MSMSTTNPARRSILVVSVLGVVALWLFLLYGRALHQVIPSFLQPGWELLLWGPLVLATDFLNPLFHSPITFIGSYLLGIGAILCGLRLVKQLLWRSMLYLLAGVALLFPLVMPIIYGRYELPIHAAEGYALRWITAPTNPYSSAYKRAQIMHEGECDYHLQGWSLASTLYYTSDCWPGLWRYNPKTDETLWSWSKEAIVNVNASAIQRWNGFLYQSPTSIRYDGESSYPVPTIERAMSPDGRWEALVIIAQFYEPSDIVLVGQTK